MRLVLAAPVYPPTRWSLVDVIPPARWHAAMTSPNRRAVRPRAASRCGTVHWRSRATPVIAAPWRWRSPVTDLARSIPGVLTVVAGQNDVCPRGLREKLAAGDHVVHHRGLTRHDTPMAVPARLLVPSSACKQTPCDSLGLRPSHRLKPSEAFWPDREIAASARAPSRPRSSVLPALTHDKDTLTSEKFRLLLGYGTARCRPYVGVLPG